MNVYPPMHWTEKLEYGLPITETDVEEAIEESLESERSLWREAEIDELCATCHKEGRDLSVEFFNELPIWRRLWYALIGWEGEHA